ncbi:MAG: SRPBCC family protein [Myxococcales bacterium]|nr:SRPBCC family protein [Myxococcales bacterium]
MTRRVRTLERAQDLPLPRDAVFPFFAEAGNLEAITPPELRFRFVTPLPIAMRAGARIEYRLSLFRVPFGWTTEITGWDPPHGFVDEERRGPFALWRHEHRFEDIDGGAATRMRDTVHYALPLSPLGELAHPLVRARLDRIFDFRAAEIGRRIAAGAWTTHG